ncbi:MAG TPA: hypothetical protein VFV50_05210 [Bdellovibrionales bacterium]|nr:hypothetical protein [Bdellovibrionales bacterium]
MKRLLWLALVLLPLKSQAYLSLLNHGDVIKTGAYRLTLSPQFITASDLGNGANFTGRFDTGIDEASDIRAVVGFGRVDFHVGGTYKWVPIPDTPDQPALGVAVGAFFARQSSVNTFSVRAFPFISKRFETDAGVFTPYSGLPLGLSATSSTTEAPVHFVLGSEWMPPGLERISFWIESGFNVSKAFSYMSLAVSLYWDDENGVEFR